MASNTEDDDYSKLAKLYSIINGDCSNKCGPIKNVLENMSSVSFQLPSNDYLASVKAHLVGCTALHFAVDSNELDVVKLLLEYKVSTVAQDNEGLTALHRAVKKNVVNGKQYWEVGGKYEQPIAYAILSAHVDLKDSSNIRSKDGISHFHLACMINHVDAVRLFIESGVPVNEAVDFTSKVLPGYTALHFATRYCSVESVELLLHHGADLFAKDMIGYSPLHIIIKSLLEIYDILRVDELLLNVDLDDYQKIMKMFFHKMSSSVLNRIDDIGLTCLHLACISNNLIAVNDIISKGQNLNVCVFETSPLWAGYTPLHFAAHVSFDAVKFLMEHEAKIDIKDLHGLTPLDLCLERYSIDDIHYLLSSHLLYSPLQFSGDFIKLYDVVRAMRDENSFDLILSKINKSATIPYESPLWPGFSLLHLVVVFSDRGIKIENLYAHTYATEYIKDDDFLLRLVKNHYMKERQKLYMHRIGRILSMNPQSVNQSDFHSSTPLHLAFYMKNRSLIRFLLSDEKLIRNAVDKNGLSHFHIACAARKTKLAEMLLNLGADVNAAITCNVDFVVSDDDRTNQRAFFNTPGWTPLHIAVVSSNYQLVKILLRHGADVFAKDEHGLTPIHRLIQIDEDQFDIGIILLSKNDSLKDSLTNFGLSHLHAASYVGHEKSVKRLLNLGVDIEGVFILPENTSLLPFEKCAGLTPLHIAMIHRHLKVTALLIKKGANVFAPRADSRNFLQDILSQDVNVCEFFYHTINSNTNELALYLGNEIGLSKLHQFCLVPDEDEVKSFLKLNESNVNCQIKSNSPIWSSKTPLHFVVMHALNSSKKEIVDIFTFDQNLQLTIQWLLHYGADVTLADGNGSTPIHLAAELLRWDAKESSELDVNIEKNSQKKIYRLMNYLLAGQRNFDVNPVDINGFSHFFIACACNEIEAVNKFLMHGADINGTFGYFDKTYAGFTPLHIAAFHKSREVVKLLLQAGADIHANDCLGNTPLHLAAEFCYHCNNAGSSCVDEEIFRVLMENGAKVEAKNTWGETPLSVFLKSGVMTLSGLKVFVQEHNCCVNIFNVKSGKGFLAEVLPRYDTHLPIEERFVYLAVLNDTTRNSCDEMGRSVIHNIVCNSQANIKSAHYTIAIQDFIGAGFNIDHQDERGWTALHYAVNFDNLNGIAGLLENGADINVLNWNKESAFVFPEEGFQTADANRIQIFNMFLLAFYRLKIAGLEISPELHKIALQVDKYFVLDDGNRSACNAEFDFLKAEEVGECKVSSFELLIYNKLTLNRLRLIHTLLNNTKLLRKKFPVFVGLLIMQYRRAATKVKMIEPAKNALNVFARIHLPDLCSEHILNFLNDDDFLNLIQAEQ